MTTTDLATVAGLFLSIWASGFGAGYFFKITRQLWEKATGVSSGG